MKELKFHQLAEEKGVARIILNRPKHNVFNIEMMEELTTLLGDLNTNADLKCVVISGTGPSWCAGVEVAVNKGEVFIRGSFTGIGDPVILKHKVAEIEGVVDIRIIATFLARSGGASQI